jgi:hypothetical protein
MCHVELVPKASTGTYVTSVRMSSEFVGILAGTSVERVAEFQLNLFLYLQSVDGFVSDLYIRGPDTVFHSSTYFSL